MRSRNWITSKLFSGFPVLILIACAVPALWSNRAIAGNWHEHIQKLSTLRGQIVTYEHEVHEMIAAKKHAEDPERIKAITMEMAAKYKDLQRVSSEYEEVRLHVRFKHPDRDLTEARNYTRHQLKTLTEMENEAGLDGRLDRVKSRVLVTFPQPIVEKPKPKIFVPSTEMRKPASVDEEEDVPEKIILRASEPAHSGGGHAPASVNEHGAANEHGSADSAHGGAPADAPASHEKPAAHGEQEPAPAQHGNSGHH